MPDTAVFLFEVHANLLCVQRDWTESHHDQTYGKGTTKSSHFYVRVCLKSGINLNKCGIILIDSFENGLGRISLLTYFMNDLIVNVIKRMLMRRYKIIITQYPFNCEYVNVHVTFLLQNIFYITTEQDAQ